jgi:hypothetical protein
MALYCLVLGRELKCALCCVSEKTGLLVLPSWGKNKEEKQNLGEIKSTLESMSPDYHP